MKRQRITTAIMAVLLVTLSCNWTGAMTFADDQGWEASVSDLSEFDTVASGDAEEKNEDHEEIYLPIVSQEQGDSDSVKESGTEGHFSYAINNGKATITKCDTEVSGQMIIPQTLDGMAVTGIANSAFDGCSNLTTLEIPNGITNIGDYAFRECSGLIGIEIPDSVNSIGKGAFWGCTELASVVLPDSITCIEDHTFQNCESLVNIVLSDNVVKLGQYSFCASGVTHFVIPDSVKEIGDCAFYNCFDLETIELPDSLTCIGEDAFYSCEKLKRLTIPNGLSSISNDAFFDCAGLKEITIPDNVTSIGDYAFSYCSSLTSIKIPNSVISIGYNAFAECDLLDDIYYAGNETQWNEVKIEEGNNTLKYATIHYNSSTTERQINFSGLCQ